MICVVDISGCSRRTIGGSVETRWDPTCDWMRNIATVQTTGCDDCSRRVQREYVEYVLGKSVLVVEGSVWRILNEREEDSRPLKVMPNSDDDDDMTIQTNVGSRPTSVLTRAVEMQRVQRASERG